jgi:hypothetical protein
MGWTAHRRRCGRCARSVLSPTAVLLCDTWGLDKSLLALRPRWSNADVRIGGGLVTVACILLVTAACGGASGVSTDGASFISAAPATSTPASTSPASDHSLVPPDAEQPAAGICEPAIGPLATMLVNPDTSAPRCLTVRAAQRLRVVNRSDHFGQHGRTVTVTFADFPPRTLRVGDATIFNRPFGEYLAPGVHFVYISLYAGGGGEVLLH